MSGQKKGQALAACEVVHAELAVANAFVLHEGEHEVSVSVARPIATAAAGMRGDPVARDGSGDAICIVALNLHSGDRRAAPARLSAMVPLSECTAFAFIGSACQWACQWQCRSVRLWAYACCAAHAHRAGFRGRSAPQSSLNCCPLASPRC